jgi:hypothetical protein
VIGTSGAGDALEAMTNKHKPTIHKNIHRGGMSALEDYFIAESIKAGFEFRVYEERGRATRHSAPTSQGLMPPADFANTYLLVRNRTPANKHDE